MSEEQEPNVNTKTDFINEIDTYVSANHVEFISPNHTGIDNDYSADEDFSPNVQIREHSQEAIKELMATEKPKLNMLYKKEARKFFVFKVQVENQELAILNVNARSNKFGHVTDRAYLADGKYCGPGQAYPIFFRRKKSIGFNEIQTVKIDILFKDKEGRQWTQCYNYSTNNSTTGKAITAPSPA
ncbi:MAG: hypothetical protein HRT72_12280 [Flavobacteriales bacterium]|nr:hypothetical protein [Flavobacteriales bacterium]